MDAAEDDNLAETLHTRIFGLFFFVPPSALRIDQANALTCGLHVSTATVDPTHNEPQRQYAIRVVFLDSFGASLGQRADHFSAAFAKEGQGERAEVTTHQMRRFFGLCGSPSNAKVSPDLVYLYMLQSFGLANIGKG